MPLSVCLLSIKLLSRHSKKTHFNSLSISIQTWKIRLVSRCSPNGIRFISM